MKILSINDECIEFDNGSTITYSHSADCCEWNYADFKQVDDLALTVEFDEELDFEVVDNVGFRFGNNDGRMFFVPCYSEQNGYYSNDLVVYFNIERVLNVDCEVID